MDGVSRTRNFSAGSLSNADGLISHLDVHGVGVGLGINRHRFDVELLACANNAHRNFAAIGDQYLFKHAE